jgi:hypothetical protein
MLYSAGVSNCELSCGQGHWEWAMISERDTRIRSYLLWEAEGRPQGRDMEFWFRAQAQLEAESRAPAPWKRPRLFVVPCAFVSSPPRKVIANRIASTKRTAQPIAATL